MTRARMDQDYAGNMILTWDDYDRHSDQGTVVYATKAQVDGTFKTLDGQQFGPVKFEDLIIPVSVMVSLTKATDHILNIFRDYDIVIGLSLIQVDCAGNRQDVRSVTVEYVIDVDRAHLKSRGVCHVYVDPEDMIVTATRFYTVEGNAVKNITELMALPMSD